LSAADGVGRLALAELTPRHGGTYMTDLSKRCTHLICGNKSSVKFEFAKKWGTPGVWLAPP
jgi:hypothetical protein